MVSAPTAGTAAETLARPTSARPMSRSRLASTATPKRTKRSSFMSGPYRAARRAESRAAPDFPDYADESDDCGAQICLRDFDPSHAVLRTSSNFLGISFRDGVSGGRVGGL